MAFRVALATNFISPYRVALYTALAETSGWELKVFCSCTTEFDRQWRPCRDTAFNQTTSISISYNRRIKHRQGVRFTDRRQVHIPLGLWWDLLLFHPDAVISDEMGARSVIAAAYTLFRRTPLVIWFYGTPHTEREANWKQRLLRKLLIRAADSFVGMGTEVRRYLESFGVPPPAIFNAPNAIDIPRAGIERAAVNRTLVRQRFGVSGLCFLNVGRLNELKGVDALLQAWEIFCADEEVDATLLIVGDGPAKKQLQGHRACDRLNNIVFVGHLEPDNIADMFCAADVFVFPTRQDVWGLVVNEALTFGLPVICSKYAGCAQDLIAEEINGWTVDPGDLDNFVRALKKAWNGRNRMPDMATAARASISNLTVQNMAEGFRNAVKYAGSGPAEGILNSSHHQGYQDS